MTWPARWLIEARYLVELADRDTARLVVSVRTLESHLARVYRKLGIASRGELAHTLR